MLLLRFSSFFFFRLLRSESEDETLETESALPFRFFLSLDLEREGDVENLRLLVTGLLLPLRLRLLLLRLSLWESLSPLTSRYLVERLGDLERDGDLDFERREEYLSRVFPCESRFGLLERA